MGIQEILLAAIFILALLFLGRMVYRSLNSDKGCASNCGKCGADFSKIKIPEKKN
jgi:bacterioferritin-associated ferredoxin